MAGNLAASTLALASLAGLAAAQEPQLVLRVGDAVQGAGKITSIDAVDVNPNGQWSALVRTDDAGPAQRLRRKRLARLATCLQHPWVVATAAAAAKTEPSF